MTYSIVVYGHKHCPSCDTAKDFLAEERISHCYFDTSESIHDLKAFMVYRDSQPEFNDAKASGAIGFPCFIINGGKKIYVGLSDEAIAEMRALRDGYLAG